MRTPRVVIVVPTYDEAENIAHTLQLTLAVALKIKDYSVHILVVDAQSPDGTGEIVKSFLKTNNNLHLLTVPRGGLGADYGAGFKFAIDKLQADFVGEMDADLQHNPEDLVKMLKAISKGADVAMGSRFITGGSIPQSWGLHRKFLSIVGNIFARLCTGMFDIHDITSGFRISKVAGFIDQISLNKLYSRRFAYKIDLCYRLHRLGAKIIEVPIIFNERQLGGSKIQVFTPLGANDWFDSYCVVSMIFVERLGLMGYLRFFKVAMIGIFGGLVQFSVYFILTQLIDLSPRYSNAFSIETAVLSNFILNFHFSFKDRKGGNLMRKIIIFHLSSLGSIFIQIIVFQIGLYAFQFGFIREYLYQIIGIWVGLLFNYFAYTNIVWRNKK